MPIQELRPLNPEEYTEKTHRVLAATTKFDIGISFTAEKLGDLRKYKEEPPINKGRVLNKADCIASTEFLDVIIYERTHDPRKDRIELLKCAHCHFAQSGTKGCPQHLKALDMFA